MTPNDISSVIAAVVIISALSLFFLSELRSERRVQRLMKDDPVY